MMQFFQNSRTYLLEDAYKILQEYIYVHKKVRVTIKITTNEDIKLFEKALINALYWYEEER